MARRPRRAGWHSVAVTAVALSATVAAGPAPASQPAAGPPSPAATAGDAGPAAPPVGIRIGRHPGFGRIVFDFAQPTRYSLARDGDHVSIHFAGAPAIGDAGSMPRNVLAIRGGAGTAEITLVHGATIREMRLEARVVIDVLDPPSSAPPPPAPSPFKSSAPAAPGGKSPADQGHAPLPQATADLPGSVLPIASPASPFALSSFPTRLRTVPVVPALDIQTAPLVPVTPETLSPGPMVVDPKSPPSAVPPPSPPAVANPAPADAVAPLLQQGTGGDSMAIAVTLMQAASAGGVGAADAGGESISVPFGPDVGVAALPGVAAALVVFDERRPLDLAMLRDDKVFGTASVQLLAAGTLLRIPLPPDGHLRLARGPHGWIVTMLGTAARQPGADGGSAAPSPVHPDLTDDGLLLPLAAPGRVVTLAEPDSGATLLVGTERAQGAVPVFQGIAAAKRTPGFVLRPSWVGVAVEPLMDDLSLRLADKGFTLSAGRAWRESGALGTPGGAAEAAALADAASLSRRYDFPALDTATLLRRLRQQIDAAATAPALARGALRRDVAETMIALGLGPEAQGVLADAAADDPKMAADPAVAGLAAIAAVVAGRPEAAAALMDPALDGTDEIALWRAVREAQLAEASAKAAAAFASTVKLAIAYPPLLVAHVLPLALESMAAGGEAAAAAPILAARKDDRALALARAELAQARGDADGALAAYDALAAGADRLVHARAERSAIDLRLAIGRITPAEAAARLDKMLLAWRGDWRERALREHLAAVQAQAGAWGAALATLREAEAVFPDDRAAIHAELAAAFADMLRRKADAAMAPIDLVALIDRNADLVPDGAEGTEIARLLADRLSALDLPGRAAPLLERLMRAAPKPQTRADLGADLAAMRLRDGDAAGAIAALSASAPPAPPDGSPPASSAVAAPPNGDIASVPPSAVPGAILTGATTGATTGTLAVAGADARPPPAEPILPPALAERRALLMADARMRDGDTAGARSALDGIATPAALLARATIGEHVHDWSAAAASLADYARRALPPQGALSDDQQRVVLRWASDASQAGDAATLAEVRDAESARMQTGPLFGMFRLLVSDHVRSVSDLKRVEQETKLAGALPEQLKALVPEASAPGR